MTLVEVSSLRGLNRHWKTSIDRSIRKLRVMSISSLPTNLLMKFKNLERLTVDHRDEMHFCDMKQLNLIPSLRYLTIQGMRMKNDSLLSIGSCTSLVELSVTDITLSKNCGEALQTFRDLKHLTKLCMRYIDVEKIEYGGNVIVENVCKIQGLKHLELRSHDMNTDVLKDLATMTALEVLCLSSSPLHIPDLEFLRPMSNLKHLALPWTHFAIYEADQIEILSNLTFLDLGATDVTDDSLKDFSKLTNLKHLSLKDDCIGDGALEHLSTLVELETLDLSHGAGLSDLCKLDHVSTLVGLKILNLNGTHITDADLEFLLPLTNLRRLDIGLTSVTDSGVENILAPLTKLEVVSTEVSMMVDMGAENWAEGLLL